jgi:hypothetical protein
MELDDGQPKRHRQVIGNEARAPPAPVRFCNGTIPQADAERADEKPTSKTGAEAAD